MKKKKELIIILGSLLVVILSVTLAYFTTEIFGTGKDISLDSANLKITFSSGNGNISGVNIEPGWSSGASTFTVKNESNSAYKYNIVIKDLVNTFVTKGFLLYKITSTDGGYNMSDFADVPKSTAATDTILAYSVEIAKGVTHTYTVEFKYASSEEDQSDDMGKILSGTLYIEKGTEKQSDGKWEDGTLGAKVLSDNPIRSLRTDFSDVFTENAQNTLYISNENNVDVYYFAGIENPNEAHCEYYNGEYFGSSLSNKDAQIMYFNSAEEYINYSEGRGDINTSVSSKEKCMQDYICIVDKYEYVLGLSEEDCSSISGSYLETTDSIYWVSISNFKLNNWVKFAGFYWRIIRTNHDGSVRLLYSGTATDTTSGYIGKSAFNSSYSDAMYAGYKYGTSGTLASNRTNENDSTIKTYIDNWYSKNLSSYTKYLSTEAVYCNDRKAPSYSANSSFDYYINTRLTAGNPTYNCEDTKDAFSVSNAEAKLTYPIGLMTADEITYAGGYFSPNVSAWYYLNTAGDSITGGTSWWLLSPAAWLDMETNIFTISYDTDYPCSLMIHSSRIERSVRPVISIKSDVLYSSGDGSPENPYEIVYN